MREPTATPITASPPDVSLVEALRRPGVARSFLGLFLAQAASTSAVTTSVVLASLVATSLAGPGVSGLPATVNTVAGALAAYVIAVVMSRRGRKVGLLAGYAVATIGAAVGCAFALAGSLPGFLLGNALMGMGQAASLQGRYAAADLVAPKVRGRVVGLLLFGSVIGAVVTALLVRPLEFVANSIDRPAASLGWGEAAIFLALGGFVMFLFFDAKAGAPAHGSRPLSRADFLAAVSRPAVGLGILNLVVGQSVMVMTMNLFPVHALQHGITLSDISTIVTIHVAGMFGLAWFIGGVVDRVGPILASAVGCLVLAAGAFISSQSSEFAGLAVGLYMIGLGWNLCFVSGSALLATNLEPEIRVRFQGMADVLVWLSAGSAVLSGGFVVGTYGYPAVASIGVAAGTALLLLTAGVWARLRRTRTVTAGAT